MADAKQKSPKAPTPFVFDVAKANAKAKAKTKAGDVEAPPAEEQGHRRCGALRWTCCVLAVVGALAALVMLVLSVTVLKVRDPTLSMESVKVKWFNVHFDASSPRPLRINVTLVGTIVLRNPNYESMRFGSSVTEIFIDGVPEYVGLGRAPPGEVSARGATRVSADLDVLVDRVGPAVVGEVLFGSGDVRLASRTAVDGRISVLGGMYGRRTVRVAMRCRVALRVSAAVVVAGSPSCVADFAR